MITKTHRAVINLVVTLLIIIPLLTTGCFNREKEPKPSGMISRSDLTTILTEMYLADGLLNNPAIRKVHESKDSIENYMDIITLHGFTKSQFDETIEYLFLHKPKTMEAVYEDVLVNLSKLEADNQKAREEERTGINKNHYTGKNNYSLPNEGVNAKVELDIPLDKPGQYILKARILLYEDDQTDNPHISMWYWYDDGSEEGHIEPWDTVGLAKTGRSKLFTLSKEMEDTLATHLRGYLFNHTDKPGHWEKHGQISNISVTYIEREKFILEDIPPDDPF
ncbi:MAG: DUF4296 domain-containing protein [Bacteroidales bacterium]|nr:DUF4296 domain-containing protein [Bacteroidales bacterium]